MLYMPIVRAVRALLPVGDSVEKDESGAEPFKMLPNRLYVWPRRIASHMLDEDAYEQGREDELFARLRILYSVGNKGEARVDEASEEVSDELDAAQHAIVGALAANRTHALWIDLYYDNVLPDVVRSERARGVGLDIVVRLAAPGEQEDDEDGS